MIEQEKVISSTRHLLAFILIFDLVLGGSGHLIEFGGVSIRLILLGITIIVGLGTTFYSNFRLNKLQFVSILMMLLYTFSFLQGTLLSCDFIFHEQPLEESKSLCDAKREYTKKYHDTAFPNFGSVFSVFNPYLLAVVSKLQLGDKNGIHYSGKTMNWIVNSNACNSSKKAFQIISSVKKMHKIFLQKCEVEVVMWR